jgi:diguanylate cyclase (GGDEF)-like protein/PAS domain S-box-containing protein
MIKFSTVRSKLTAAILSLILMLLAIFVFATISASRTANKRTFEIANSMMVDKLRIEREANIESFTELLADMFYSAVLRFDLKHISEITDILTAKKMFDFLFVADADGKIIGESNPMFQVRYGENIRNLPELKGLYNISLNGNRRNNEHMFVSKPISYNSDVIGYVVVGFKKTEMMTGLAQAGSSLNSVFNNTRTKLLINLFLVAFIVSILAVFMSNLISKSVTTHVLRLLKLAESIGRGEYVMLSEERRDDELGELENSIYQMQENIVNREKELEALNVTLEDRVKVRTADLQKLNRQLKVEIYEKKLKEDKLLLYASIFKNSNESILITDTHGIIEKVNSAFTELTGYTEQEVRSRTPNIIKSGRHDRKYYEKLWISLLETGHWSGEVWNMRKGGEVFAALVTIDKIYNSEGEFTNYVGIMRDISERKRNEEELHKQAFYDPLTGLPNRALCYERLKSGIAAAKRKEEKLAVMFLDLDKFKTINDTQGHEAGDRLLVVIAEVLAECCRETDTVCRLGGDEFVVIMPEIHSYKNIYPIADRILEAVAMPIIVDGYEIRTSTSIGITFFPDDGEAPDKLLKNADIAMYRAKSRGRNTYEFFTQELEEEVLELYRTERRIRKAVSEREFVYYYQPVVDMEQKLVGFEALLRWIKEGEVVEPEYFMSTLEESGLIIQLSRFMFIEACRFIKRLNSMLGTDLYICLNISPQHFQSGNLQNVISSIIKRSEISTGNLVAEITENMMIFNEDTAVQTIRELRDMGVCISIDDFGKGYSSFSLLKQFLIDRVKIDRMFINSIPDSREDMLLTDAMMSVADSLNIEVSAEGVERTEQIEYLSSKNCKYMQGYFFSGPLPEIQAVKFARDRLVVKREPDEFVMM